MISSLVSVKSVHWLYRCHVASHAEILATLWHCTMFKAVEGSYMSTGRIPCHKMKRYSERNTRSHEIIDFGWNICRVCKKMKIRGAGGIIFSMFLLHQEQCESIANFKCWDILRLLIWIYWIWMNFCRYACDACVHSAYNCLSLTATLQKQDAASLRKLRHRKGRGAHRCQAKLDSSQP